MATNISQMIVRVLGDTTHVRGEMAALRGEMANFAVGINQQAAITDNVFAKMGTGMSAVGASFQTIGAGLTQFVTVPLALASAAAIKTGIEFEQAFAGVKKTVNEGVDPITGAVTSFDVLRLKVLEISRATGIAMNDVAGVMQVAGQLGIRGNEALSAFTETVSKMTLATDMSAESISMMLGRFAAISGLDVEKDIGRVADIIVNLGNNSATTEDAILKFGVRIAAVGRLAGLSAEEIFAISAAAESTGTKAERGGTAITKIFLKMQSEAFGAGAATTEYTSKIDENAAALREWEQRLQAAKDEQAALGASASTEQIQRLSEEIATASENIASYTESGQLLSEELATMGDASYGFAKALGMSSDEFSALYKSSGGSIEIFNRFIGVLGEAQAEGKDVNAIMKDLELTDSRLVQAVLSLAQANDEGSLSMSSLANTLLNARDATGALNEEFAKRMDTTGAQFDRFKQILGSIAVLLTDDVNGLLKDFLKNINDVMEKFVGYLQTLTPEQFANITKAIGALIALGPGMFLLGGFLKTFGTSFSLLGTILGNTYGVFGLAATNLDKLGAAGSAAGGALSNLQGGAAGALMHDGTLLGNVGSSIAPGNAVATRLNHNEVSGQFMKKSIIPSIFGKEITTNALDMGGESGDAFQGTFLQRAFGTANTKYKAAVDNFVLNTKAAITDKLGTATATGNMLFPVQDKGKAIAGQPAMYSGPASSSLTPGLEMADNKLTSFLGGAMKFVGMLATSIPQIGMLLGGLALVLAVVAGAFATFFITTGKDAADVTSIFDGLSEKVSGFGDKIQTAITDMIAKFPEFSSKFGEIFVATVEGIGGLLIALIGKFFEMLPEFLTLGAMLISSLIDGFVNYLPTLLSTIVDILAALFKGFLDAAPAMVSAGFKILTSLVTGLIRALPMLLTAAVGLIIMLGKVLLEKIADGTIIQIGVNIISGIIVGLVSMLAALMQAVGDIFSGLLNYILKFFGIASPSKVMAEIGSFIIEGLLNGIKAYFAVLKFFWITVPKFLLDAFIGAVKWLYDVGKDILSGLWNGIKWYYENLFKLYFNVGKWIIDAVKGAGTWLYDAGKNIIQGLKDGIFNGASSIASWFSDIGSKVVNGVTTFFKIKSPSRVMMGLGNMIGEGLAIGLQDTNKDIAKAAEEMQNAAMIDPEALASSMSVNGKMTHDYTGLTEAFVSALESVGLNVYMDGKDVTDVVASHLTLAQRRGR